MASNIEDTDLEMEYKNTANPDGLKELADQLKFNGMDMNEDDEKAFNLFRPAEIKQQKSLAEYVMEKFNIKRDNLEQQFSDVKSMKIKDLDPKVVKLYKGVKAVMARYRQGKVPKAFKVIPQLSNWEQILVITAPHQWTSAAMCQATNIFISNLKEGMAQRFLNLVLLPRLRDEISEFKRLNFHLYAALKKSLFKPGAFFKGILIPLCQAGDCTLREAIIISSVMSKTSIPLMHACAAMLRIAEMDYSGANSIFLLTLIKKKYALPYRVIDAIVAHFMRFTADKRQMPVLWYQSFLFFVELYSKEISPEQKEHLRNVLNYHKHPKLKPEILRHLDN